MNQLTIDLPDQLLERLNTYLKANPGETLGALIQEAIEIKLTPENSAKLLELAGIVTDAPRGAADHAEDFDN